MKKRYGLVCAMMVAAAASMFFAGCNKSDISDETTTTGIEKMTTTVESETTTEVVEPETTLGPVYDEVEAPRAGTEILTDRALTAVDLAGSIGGEVNVTADDAKGVYLSWRYMSADNENTRFTLYKNGEVLEENIVKTNYIDLNGKYGDVYKVVANNDEYLGLKTIDTEVWANYYQEFTLNTPAPQLLPDGTTVEFSASDMSVADLDNDGQYELVVKWWPDNAKDNSQQGYTGYTYIDGYDVNFATGEAVQLWRIDLGPNIRSGAHYTQCMVWDMDGDGIAEVACKTADGSTTYKMMNGGLVETGYVGACNSAAIPSYEVTNEYDYRTTSGKSTGYILNGPEYLTIFRGDTGEIIDTVDYWPERGNVGSWGDTYGNRVDRFLACVAYLDGENPSMVFCRGYYTRVTMAAYRLIDGKLSQVWNFDSYADGNREYSQQGNHGISVADADGDGRDEIIYGSLVMDDDGTPLYSNGLGHGDAMQVGDLLPGRPGLESLNVYETKTAKYQFTLRDLATGEILFGLQPKIDNGRGLCADIDPRYEGEELWSNADKNVYSATSTFENVVITSEGKVPSKNFAIYWDGDLLRELQDYKDYKLEDGTTQRRCNVTKWDYEKSRQITLLETSECIAMVATKEKMGIVADVIGDWREEIISRHPTERDKIRIYMSTIPTEYNVDCLMSDETYRLGTVWQNVAYNQPAHLGYALTDGLCTSVLTAERINDSEIKINFTKASDGRYGHEIEGYAVYRKQGLGEFEEIAVLGTDVLEYLDTQIKADMMYTYKVAAIVDGKTSYYSLPVVIEPDTAEK